jgi:hypothetical protein
MKKVISGIFLLVLLLNFIVATDVAYISRNERRIDSSIIDTFNEMSLDVEIINNKDVGDTDFSDYKLIFIGDERLRRVRDIPVNENPSVIINRYYGRQFGLLDKGGIPKMAANSPLKVLAEELLIQVYDRSRFLRRRINLPYYFLPEKYQNDNMESVAMTAQGRKKGSVIAYSNQGTNKCFFGIPEAKFWTEETKVLFKNCVNFVLNSVEEDTEEETSEEPVEDEIPSDDAEIPEEEDNNDGDSETQSWYCEADDSTRSDCVGLSGGLGTRCYLDEEHTNWDYCSGGWVLVA